MNSYPNIFNITTPINPKNQETVVELVKTLSLYTSRETCLCDSETGEILLGIKPAGDIFINHLVEEGE